jgi:hypothetical protein
MYFDDCELVCLRHEGEDTSMTTKSMHNILKVVNPTMQLIEKNIIIETYAKHEVQYVILEGNQKNVCASSL